MIIGASLNGIVIRQGPEPIFHKWNDITNLVNHKRYFGVEFQNYENGVQFILDETESAKYVWKMCKLIIYYVSTNYGHIICNGYFPNSFWPIWDTFGSEYLLWTLWAG